MKPRSTRCLRSGGRPLRNVPRRGPVHRRNILMLIGYNANVLTLLTCMVRSVAKAFFLTNNVVGFFKLIFTTNLRRFRKLHVALIRYCHLCSERMNVNITDTNYSSKIQLVDLIIHQCMSYVTYRVAPGWTHVSRDA